MQTKIFRIDAARSEIVGSWHDGPKAYGVDPLHCVITFNGETETNGRPFQLSDLKPGDLALLDGQPAVRITATRG